MYQALLIVSKWYHYIKFCFHLNTAKLSIDFESVDFCLKFVQHLESFISIWISLYTRTCINCLSCYLYSVQIEVNLWLSGQNILVCAFLKRKISFLMGWIEWKGNMQHSPDTNYKTWSCDNCSWLLFTGNLMNPLILSECEKGTLANVDFTLNYNI